MSEEGVDVRAGSHLGIKHAGEAQDHHEHIERGKLPVDGVCAEMGPVTLGLAPGWSLEAHHQLFAYGGALFLLIVFG